MAWGWVQLEVELVEEGCSKTGHSGTTLVGPAREDCVMGTQGSVSMWRCAIRRIG